MSGEQHKINEERVCADALAQFLKEESGARDVNIEETGKGNDPPDFWLTINGNRLPVEVTSITEGQDREAAYRRFVEDVRGRAASEGILKGEYLLHSSFEPMLPKRCSEGWRVLVGKAIDFIVTTEDKQAGTVAGVVLSESRHRRVAICKVGDTGGAVEHVTSGARWQTELEDSLGRLMEERLGNKKDKLAGAGFAEGSVVLVLYDAYTLGFIDVRRDILLEMKEHIWFHSVFLARSCRNKDNERYSDEPGGEGQFLYSVNPNWWTRPEIRIVEEATKL